MALCNFVIHINELCDILFNEIEMTAQFDDQLIYNDEIYSLEDTILEPFLHEKNLKSESDGYFSACWRGYIATYEIKNFEIHLKSENSEFFDKIISQLGTTKLIYLNHLIVLYKNQIEGNWTVKSMNKFESYEILEFKNGTLTDFKIVNHDEFEKFKENQFREFVKTPEYQNVKNGRIQNINNENEELRKSKGKGPNWHKFKFKEDEFLNEVKDNILHYTKIFY